MRTFLLLLNPFAPHITEEIWECQNFGGVVTDHSFPKYDESKCVDSEIEVVVQVNGKVRAKLMLPVDCTSEQAIAQAKADERIVTAIGSMNVVKEIYVKGKLVNLVVK